MNNIIILGCGIVGATIAYELSLISNLKITVVDRNFPASGSTGAALGVLMGVISGKIKGRAWQLRENSLKRYNTLIPELESLTGIEIPHNRQGILKLLLTEAEREKSLQLAEKRAIAGWKLEVWDRDRLQSQCPQIDANLAVAALYSPEDRQINPTILTRALVAGAKKNGVNFHFEADVELGNCTSEGEELKYCDRLKINGEIIKVDRLIIAAGLGSTKLTQDLATEIIIRPVLGQAIKLKTKETIGDRNFQPVITADDIHLVPLGNNEYWVGATVEFPETEENNMEKKVDRQELLDELYRRAIHFYPALTKAEIIEKWSGKRPRPEGIAAPIIGKLPRYDNVFLATGHYRNGVLLAPATALEIKILMGLN